MKVYKPLISVVIPVYNVEKYMDEALRSVLRQTYTEWEMILVDDGSTDKSGEICDKFAKAHENVEVYHISNGGIAHARNVGLEHSRGQWISFLDSDDYLVDDAFEIMLKYSKGVDVVACGMERFPEFMAYRSVNYPTTYSNLEDAGKDIASLFACGTFFSACNKLYRAESIKEQFDNNLRHAEDLLFNLKYMSACNGICVIPDLLYQYRVVSEATLTKRFWLDQFDISKRTLLATREIFGCVPVAKQFFENRFAFEISKHFMLLSKITSISEEDKIMILMVRLEDDIFDYPEIQKIQLEGGMDKIWEACKNKKAESVLLACADFEG